MVATTEAGIHAEVAANLVDIAQAVSWRMVREVTKADPVMSRLRQEVEEGHLRDGDSTARPIPAEIANYGKHMDNLSVQDDVILYNNRRVIPEKLRERVLDTLHSAHQGSSQMWNRAGTSVFWPGAETLRTDRLGAPPVASSHHHKSTSRHMTRQCQSSRSSMSAATSSN